MAVPRLGIGSGGASARGARAIGAMDGQHTRDPVVRRRAPARLRPVVHGLLSGALLVAAAGALGAQGVAAPPDSSRHAANVWLVYNGRHALSARWALFADAQVRRADGLARPKQWLVRPGLRYRWREHVSLTAGYAFQRTSPHGLLAEEIPTDEHRVWQQIEVERPAGRTALEHRLRLEQRWEEDVSDAGGTARVTGRGYQNRARYRLSATRPLHGGEPDAPGWYLAASDEPFVRWGPGVGRTFDQNRAFVGLGRRWSDGLRVEGGYLNQYARAGSGRAVEVNHVLQLTLVSEVPLRRGVR
jgi:hypothetical protein